MKNRKIVVTAFLLIAVMILSVGYAAVSDTIFFNGDATISDDQAQQNFDLDVGVAAVSEDTVTWYQYDAAKPEIEIEDDLTVDIYGTGDNARDNVEFQIYSLADKDSSQTIWFKVVNESAHDATLIASVVTESGTGDYFNSEYYIYTAADGLTETTTIPAEGEVFVKLTITVKATPAETYQGTFSFNIHAEVAPAAVQP